MPRTPCLLGFLLLAACGTAPQRASEMIPATRFTRLGEPRRFEIRYVAHVTGIPAGTARLRLWIPVPRSTSLQTIRDLQLDGPVPVEVATEPTLGNEIACFEVPSPPAEVSATMRFVVERREVHADLDALRGDVGTAVDADVHWLQPSRLEVIDDRIRATAAALTRNERSVVGKARAIYDYVLAHMDYDKSVPGWGHGDSVRACDVGKGNCTDFHALFVSLARAAGIPAGFEVGLYVPYERHVDEPVGGYHCWAWFEVPGRTWVPVDVSEADRHPERADFFFGAHTDNRVALSVGRDVPLVPPQAGPPLNYFVDPYAEADGEPVPATKQWSYRDL